MLPGNLIKFLEKIIEYKNEDNRILSPTFYYLPKKATYPDYYEIIKNPTSLSRIRSQIKQLKIKNYEMLKKELNILFDNAMEYNDENSIIYQVI